LTDQDDIFRGPTPRLADAAPLKQPTDEASHVAVIDVGMPAVRWATE
jgi:hypothetical protein